MQKIQKENHWVQKNIMTIQILVHNCSHHFRLAIPPIAAPGHTQALNPIAVDVEGVHCVGERVHVPFLDGPIASVHHHPCSKRYVYHFRMVYGIALYHITIHYPS